MGTSFMGNSILTTITIKMKIVLIGNDKNDKNGKNGKNYDYVITKPLPL